MTGEMIRIGLKELAARWRTTLGMVAGVGVALLVFLALESITNGARVAFAPPEEPRWIVQQRGSMGEFYGSRLPGDYRDRLLTLGASSAAGEVHSAVGATRDDVMLLRGVPLDHYRDVERFTMVAGEPLRPGDEDVAMSGAVLAETKGWAVGEVVTAGSRVFAIQGIFQTNTLADNELWLPLPDAQEVIGFDRDVSIYVVHGDDDLPDRIESALPVEVTREGEGLVSLLQSLEDIVRLLRVVSAVMAVAAALSILSVMFTMVRTRHREMAILRSIGFGRGALVIYVLAQAGAVALAGYTLALLAILGLAQGLGFQVTGVTITPLVDWRVATLALAWSSAIGLVAGIYPAILVARLDMAQTLRSE